MNTLTPERMKAESRAMEHLQRAQDELARATNELSKLRHGSKVWASTHKLREAVHVRWYKLESFSFTTKYYLDDTNVAAILAREAKAANVTPSPSFDPRDKPFRGHSDSTP